MKKLMLITLVTMAAMSAQAGPYDSCVCAFSKAPQSSQVQLQGLTFLEQQHGAIKINANVLSVFSSMSAEQTANDKLNNFKACQQALSDMKKMEVCPNL